MEDKGKYKLCFGSIGLSFLPSGVTQEKSGQQGMGWNGDGCDGARHFWWQPA